MLQLNNFTSNPLQKLQTPSFEEPSKLMLHSSWTLYLDKTPKSGVSLKNYTQNLTKIYKISTIEEFWQVFNNIPAADHLPNCYSFHLMRGDRQPIWEDPLNKNGGYYKLKCHRNFTNHVWRELVLAVVGEQFLNTTDDSDSIVGISVSLRDHQRKILPDHFQIWNENYKLAAETKIENNSLISYVKDNLLPEVIFCQIYYKAHKKHDDFGVKYSKRSTFRGAKYLSGNRHSRVESNSKDESLNYIILDENSSKENSFEVSESTSDRKPITTQSFWRRKVARPVAPTNTPKKVSLLGEKPESESGSWAVKSDKNYFERRNTSPRRRDNRGKVNFNPLSKFERHRVHSL